MGGINLNIYILRSSLGKNMIKSIIFFSSNKEKKI